jgi:hypothetical protein
MIISYSFNAPKATFENAGTLKGDTYKLVAPTHIVQVDGSGQPAKDRGYFFDKTKVSYIKLPKIALNHTFSIHFWVLVKSVAEAGKVHTIFCKDRGFPAGKTTLAENNFLRIGIDENSKLSVVVAAYEDPATLVTKTSTGLVNSTAWKYVVTSFEYADGLDT